MFGFGCAAAWAAVDAYISHSINAYYFRDKPQWPALSWFAITSAASIAFFAESAFLLFRKWRSPVG